MEDVEHSFHIEAQALNFSARVWLILPFFLSKIQHRQQSLSQVGLGKVWLFTNSTLPCKIWGAAVLASTLALSSFHIHAASTSQENSILIWVFVLLYKTGFCLFIQAILNYLCFLESMKKCWIISAMGILDWKCIETSIVHLASYFNVGVFVCF